MMYEGDLAIPGRVEIRHEACDSALPAVMLPLNGAAGRLIRRVAGRVPDGLTLPAGGAQVRVQVYFDGDGVPHLPTYASGPATLANAAIDAAGAFRAEPPRVNGAALLQASTITVAFAGSPD
jgi:hypothetical protein